MDIPVTSGLRGRLLVALPQLKSGPFARSVVLICQHDQHHAFGVMVNKPISGLSAKDAVTEIRLSPALTAETAPVYFGGPCESQRGFVLHSADYHGPMTLTIADKFGLTGTSDALERLLGDQIRPQTSRLIAGYAGWSAGQLDDEIRRHYWLDLEANPNIVFGQPPEEMWDAALAQIGVSASSLSALGLDSDASRRPLN